MVSASIACFDCFKPQHIADGGKPRCQTVTGYQYNRQVPYLHRYDYDDLEINYFHNLAFQYTFLSRNTATDLTEDHLYKNK